MTLLAFPKQLTLSSAAHFIIRFLGRSWTMALLALAAQSSFVRLGRYFLLDLWAFEQPQFNLFFAPFPCHGHSSFFLEVWSFIAAEQQSFCP